MSVNLQTIKDIRKYLKLELSGIYPVNEAEAITNHIFKTQFGIDRLQLLSDPGQIVSAMKIATILAICAELKTGKPLQYVIGETSFYNCIIKVSQDTLIPRPETEELADLIIKENPGFRGSITDIGTGSGCIAIALKKNLPDAQITATDISGGALKMAITNSVLNNVSISFLKYDILSFDSDQIIPSDIIVSNPPYVTEHEKQFMKKNVLDFEPHNALFVPDSDPLIFYMKIVDFARKALSRVGKIYFEINESKGDEILSLLESAGFSEVRILQDLNGKNRFATGRKNG
jgi:release factor glutamine methyltransferase